MLTEVLIHFVILRQLTLSLFSLISKYQTAVFPNLPCAAHNDKKIAAEVEFLKKVKAHLEDGQLAKTFVTEDEDEQALLNECNLLTAKPVIFAANVSEDDLADDGAENDYVQKVREYAKSCEAEVFVVCAQIEQEIAELDDDEKAMFLEDLGLKESGLEKLIKASYSLLGLISYLTAGPIESKAWTITRGTKAPQAAGKIHSDFERGFIKADVISYEDLIANGSMTAARDKGLVRSEGKEYVMRTEMWFCLNLMYNLVQQ